MIYATYEKLINSSARRWKWTHHMYVYCNQ